MKVLVIDIGGTHVKIHASGQRGRREFDSGPHLTPRAMVQGVKKLTSDWKYDVISIGYPGLVLHDRPVAEPHNLGHGWVGFDFRAAFRRPVKLINDAALQALGCYRRGKMLFLGLGTGFGSCLIMDGIVEPLELAHLPYRKGTYEDYVGLRGLKKRGKKKWRRHVAAVIKLLTAAIEPTDVVIGGGNAKKLSKLPRGCRPGDNSKAFVGGVRLWERSPVKRRSRRASQPKARVRRKTIRAVAVRKASPRKTTPRRKRSPIQAGRPALAGSTPRSAKKPGAVRTPRPTRVPTRHAASAVVGRSVPTPPRVSSSGAGAVGTPRPTQLSHSHSARPHLTPSTTAAAKAYRTPPRPKAKSPEKPPAPPSSADTPARVSSQTHTGTSTELTKPIGSSMQ